MVRRRQVVFTEISPSEFFYRNRDLAGFSNPTRALYSAVRELVENSLDACEQFGILPEVQVTLSPLEQDRFDPKVYQIKVKDNGPGIDPKYVPEALGRVFYGSKFKLRQSRGMFGMGGTMAILYGQITTNIPVRIWTCIDGKNLHYFKLMIDIQHNKPIVLEKNTIKVNEGTGMTVELSLIGDYSRSSVKIVEYFKQTAMVTPYANLYFTDPHGREWIFERNITSMPPPPRVTLPHPYGIDVEALRRIIRESKQENLLRFMSKNFHRVGERIALKFLNFAGFEPKRNPKSLTNSEIVKLANAMRKFDGFLQPDASCLSPLGEELLKAGIEKELRPEFVAVVTRTPSAYSGYPFIVEVGLAYGGKYIPPGLTLYRFANRIPLLYDEASDVAWKVIKEDIDLRRYKVTSDTPLAVITHICSTKVPYKTVGKEFVADRPEVERELRNALREVLRKLSIYLSKKGSIEKAKKRLNIYAKYLPLIARFATELAGKRKPPHYRVLLSNFHKESVAESVVEKYG